MSISIKTLWKDYGIGGILFAIVALYGMYLLYNKLSSKGMGGSEMMTQARQAAYSNAPSGPQPAQEGDNERFSSVQGGSQTMTMPSSCTGSSSTQNPSDLLPRDTNSQWAQLNPVGKGDLGSINLLKAGYHIGIDTVGQTLRNANQQIRSDPPNPQINVGPWNQSTIEPDFMRPPLELGQGVQ